MNKKVRRGRPPLVDSLKKALLASTAECLKLEEKVKSLEVVDNSLRKKAELLEIKIAEVELLKKNNEALESKVKIMQIQIHRTEGACAWLEYKLDKINATC